MSKRMGMNGEEAKWVRWVGRWVDDWIDRWEDGGWV